MPDEIVFSLVEHVMTDDVIEHGYIFDGYPRTENQARALDQCCEKKHAPIDAVLCLTCPEEIIIQRITGRRVCPNCARVYHVKNLPPKIDGMCDQCGSALVQRADDTEEVVRTRLREYRQSTQPVVDYYKKTNRLVTLNSGPGADVFHLAAATLEREE